MRVAIVGLGNIAHTHRDAILSIPGAQIVAGVDLDEARKEMLPPGALFYTDYMEMASRESPDVIHLCLPHYLHYSVARDLAAMGKNLFCEKPLALNLNEALKFCELDEKNGIKACVCFQNRMNKSVQALYERLKSGDYGQVLGIRGDVAWKRDKAYYDAAPWRGSKALAGNGVLLNQAIHTLDLLLYLAQSDCVSVSGWTGKVFDNGADAEDSAVARLGFANGAEGLFTATLANFRDAPVLVDVQTEKALFRIYNDALYEGDRELAKNDAIPVQASGKAVYGMGHLPLIARFYAALENNTADYIHPRDALPVMRVIDAIEA